jgi:short subunit dehydrogenase-like uncharacterized protein
LTEALGDVAVLITCVGPFSELGSTAVEAALQAKVHYIDSTGEGPFIRELIETKMGAARDAGIAMAPAMGFDEVPADCAATLASEGMRDADVTLSYALPTQFSTGTLRSIVGIAAAEGPWLEDGNRTWIRPGDVSRWAPMPPPLGPKQSVSFPLAEAHLAPLHLDLKSFRTFFTVGSLERIGIKLSRPLLPHIGSAPIRAGIEKVVGLLPEGPTAEQRHKGRWAILAEARSGSTWRNVALSGRDVYGLTAEFLSAAALEMARRGPRDTGVVAPVQAVGIETFEKEFTDHEVVVDVFEPR